MAAPPVVARQQTPKAKGNWYVISYDLNREIPPTTDDYHRIHNALRTAYDFCWSLYSFWIIETPLSPRGVINRLFEMKAIDDDDGVVVLEITGVGDFCNVREQNIADWLNERIVRR